jgi:hypothetical protein
VRQLKDAILTSESTFLIGEGVLKDNKTVGVVLKYHSNTARLDQHFANKGVFIFQHSSQTTNHFLYAKLIEDGRSMVLVGEKFQNSSAHAPMDQNIFVAKIDTQLGVLDTKFGNKGVFSLGDSKNKVKPTSVLILKTGEILISASSNIKESMLY